MCWKRIVSKKSLVSWIDPAIVTSRRLLKAAEAIREVVASAILTEIRDPRVKDVTVIGVEVTPDMREAVVSVSVMGDESQKQLSLRGLQNSAGFLQSKIANRIDTRFTPRLRFELNRGIENALVVGELLGKIRREKEADTSRGQTENVVGDFDRPDDENADENATDEHAADEHAASDAAETTAAGDEDRRGVDAGRADPDGPRPPEWDG